MQSGIRYKKHMIYLSKDEHESVNNYNIRLWFVVKNITKSTFDELVILSKYYYNIYFNKMNYNSSIHDKIDNML